MHNGASYVEAQFQNRFLAPGRTNLDFYRTHPFFNFKPLEALIQYKSRPDAHHYALRKMLHRQQLADG